MVNTIEPPLKPGAAETQEGANPPSSLELVQDTDKQSAPAKESRLPETPKKLLQRFEDFLIPALVLFLIGNALAYALPDLAFTHWQVGLPLILVLIGIVIYGGGKPENRWVIRLDLWMIFLLVGSLYYSHRQFTPGPTDVSHLAPLQHTEVMGTLVSFRSKNQAIVEVSSANGQKTNGRILAYLPTSQDHSGLEAGTRLLMDGSLELPFHNPIPGTFNQLEYLRSQHITALLKHPSRLIAFEASNQPQFVIQRITDQLKRRVAETFAYSLPSPQSEILGGIVLGDKAIPVDKETKQAFIQTGLIHVLAASGMNVGIIAGAVLWLLTRLKVAYRTRVIVAMVAVGFYSLMTGMPPSIQRAATMLELALALKLLNRELSSVFLLCLASSLLVLFNPENIASIGFQFSVLTTFGLLSMLPPLQEAIGYYTTRWLAGLVLVPIIAQLWIWPLSIAYFNQFPIHTVPLNIGALALIIPLTIIGFTAGVISLLIPPLGGLISWIARPFLDCLLWMVNWGSSLTWAQWSLPSPAPWQIAVLYLCLFGMLLAVHRMQTWPKRRQALAILVPIALLLGGLWYERTLDQAQAHVDLLPISSQREAWVVRPPHTNAVLLIAPENPSYYEARSLADYLKHRHLERLDAVLLMPAEDAKTTNSLKAALQRTQIGLLMTASNRPLPTHLTVESHQVFPERGGRINLGTMKLQGQIANLRLISGQYCLLALTQAYQSNPAEAGCALQATLNNNNKRFFSEAGLSPNNFYQMIADRSEVTIY